MTRLFTDTHPKIEALQIQLLRDLPPWRKLEMVDDLNRAVRSLTWEGLRLRHPEADETELRRRLALLLLGAEMSNKINAYQNKQTGADDGSPSAA
jgi:hypothetical protein